jgi:hypothetical protein
MPHEFFDYLQRGAGIKELGSKGVAQRMGGIGCRETRQCKVAGHAVANVACPKRLPSLARLRAGEEVAGRRGPEPVPLP